MTRVSGGRRRAVRQDGDRDSPEIKAVIGHAHRGEELTEVEDAKQGLCHAKGTPYDFKIQRQRRDETRLF